MVPPEDVNNIIGSLVRSIEVEWDKHLNCGIIGVKYVPEVLAKFNFIELAYKSLTQETFPSFGYMIKEGATTLWEIWEPLTGSAMNSHNHHMFGSIDAWFYRYIAGLEILEAGFRKFKVKPSPINDLMRVSASVYVPARGLIAITWWKENQCFKLKLSVPVNSIAEIYLPKIDNRIILKEGDKYIIIPVGEISKIDGILKIREKEKYILIMINSGNYNFSMIPIKDSIPIKKYKNMVLWFHYTEGAFHRWLLTFDLENIYIHPGFFDCGKVTSFE